MSGASVVGMKADAMAQPIEQASNTDRDFPMPEPDTITIRGFKSTRLLVHVEGATEEMFVNEVLAPQLYECGYEAVGAGWWATHASATDLAASSVGM